MRAIGGSLFIIGAFIALYNVIMTARKGSKVTDELAEAAPLERVTKHRTAKEGYHYLVRKKTG